MQKIIVIPITKDKGIFIMKCSLSHFIFAIAYLGRNGVSQSKKENDGTTPAGTYKLGIAFGTKKMLNTNITYIPIDENYYWVDDEKSKYYNEMVNVLQVEKDWKSAEHLISYKIQYEYAIEIKYNQEKIKGKGSAIFLHCSANKPTAGCIAIKKEKMLKVLKNLEENAIISIYDIKLKNLTK